MSSVHLLVIVIPAYKPEFLALTLQSIARQQFKCFRVYVGDDASPADLAGICRNYEQELDLHYVRFPFNLGQKNLVAHWNRCVQLTTEPWVWLFSDDDLMEPDCVGRLLDGIRSEGERFDLFHFNVTTIDAAGAVLRHEPEFPPALAAHEFAAARLRCELASYAPDYIFSRAAFDRIGGFVEFPLAWCSDDATWIAIAGSRGIRTLDGPKVRWRLSGQNISASSGTTVLSKAEALVSFLLWLDDYLRKELFDPGDRRIVEVMEHSPSWLYRQMKNMNARLWPSLALLVVWRLRHLPHHGLIRDLFRTIQFDVQRLRREWSSKD